jgi:hypothetical protein
MHIPDISSMPTYTAPIFSASFAFRPSGVTPLGSAIMNFILSPGETSLTVVGLSVLRHNGICQGWFVRVGCVRERYVIIGWQNRAVEAERSAVERGGSA